MQYPPQTTSGTRIFTRQERNNLKDSQQHFKQWNKLWNSSYMGTIKRIGPCMELVARSGATKELEWHKWYYENFKSFTAVEELGKEWAKVSGLPVDIALAHVMIHIFDDTWNGWLRENNVIKYLNKFVLWDAQVARPDYKWDKEFGIDIIVPDATTEHGFIYCYQVKPGSFFGTGRNFNSKDHLREQHKKAEAMGLKPMFINTDELLSRGIFHPIHWSEI